MSPTITGSNAEYPDGVNEGDPLLKVHPNRFIANRFYTLSVLTPHNTNTGIKFSNDFEDYINLVSPTIYNTSRLCTGGRIEWSFRVKGNWSPSSLTDKIDVLVIGMKDSLASWTIQLSDMRLSSKEPLNEIKPISFDLTPRNGIKKVDEKITSKLTWELKE